MIYRQISDINFISTDLIPLLATEKEDSELITTILRLLEWLTKPPEREKDKEKPLPFLQTFKQAFIQSKEPMSVLAAIAVMRLENLHDKINRRIVHLFLLLLKSLLSIDDQRDLHSLLIVQMSNAGIFEIVSDIGQRCNLDSGKMGFNFILLEMLSLVFSRDDPRSVYLSVKDESTRLLVEKGEAKEGRDREGASEMLQGGRGGRGGGRGRGGRGGMGLEGIISSEGGSPMPTILPRKRFERNRFLGGTYIAGGSRVISGISVSELMISESRPSPYVAINKARKELLKESSPQAKAEMNRFADLCLKIFYAGLMKNIIEDFNKALWEKKGEEIVLTDYVHFFSTVRFFTAYYTLAQKTFIKNKWKYSKLTVYFDPHPIMSTLEVFEDMIQKIDNLRKLEKNHSLFEVSVGALSELLKVLNILHSNPSFRSKVKYSYVKLVHNSALFLDPLVQWIRHFKPTFFSKNHFTTLIECLDSVITMFENDGHEILIKKKRGGRIKEDEDMKKVTNLNRDEDESEEEEDGEFNSRSAKIVPLQDYLYRFVSKDVIRQYLRLLLDFKENRMNINRAILKFLNHIVENMKLAHMFYQLSHLRILHEILVKLPPKTDKYQPIANFVNNIVHSFLMKAKKDERGHLFVQSLFTIHRPNIGSYSTMVDEILIFEDEEEEEEGEEKLNLKIVLEDLPEKKRKTTKKKLKTTKQGPSKTTKQHQDDIYPWTPKEEEELKKCALSFKDEKDLVQICQGTLGGVVSYGQCRKKLLEMGLIDEMKLGENEKLSEFELTNSEPSLDEMENNMKSIKSHHHNIQKKRHSSPSVSHSPTPKKKKIKL